MSIDLRRALDRQTSGFVGAVALICLTLASSSAAQIVPAARRFESDATTRVPAARVACAVAEFRPQARALVEGLKRLGVPDTALVRDAEMAGVSVVVERAETASAEAYRIQTKGGQLRVAASAPVGVARAAATLLQALDAGGEVASFPSMEVDDGPRRGFRCFMVDMGRNPHPPAVLRQLVDALWFYKVRYLHLHLTDDQLISWPSRVFPKLYSERAGWTRDDFVELERYSQARGVTLIPELEVPGHSTILRREYPEVFGKTPTDLATDPAALEGFASLLDEVLEVFQATPYVHVGGDEAYGVPVEAQRDFLNSLNELVKARGRRTLVWEGPGLGEGANKVATDVIHLNWRTINFPAQQMLDAGYEIVNAAWDPLYIVDHYPRTMFTAVSVRRCYEWNIRRFAHVDPGMPTFERPQVVSSDERILGYCMPWWEGRRENLLPLCVPRLAAVNAAAWNRPAEQDFEGFESRQALQLPRCFELMGLAAPELPRADPTTEAGNLAFGAEVTASTGMTQPVFGPQRLTNGLTDRFDHFLGYPTKPQPLEITVDLGEVTRVGRVVVHETAVGESHEIYELQVSPDGSSYERVGAAKQGSRGQKPFVEHEFSPRPVRYVRVVTQGCHGLTFPSFSRLTEIEVFAKSR